MTRVAPGAPGAPPPTTPASFPTPRSLPPPPRHREPPPTHRETGEAAPGKPSPTRPGYREQDGTTQAGRSEAPTARPHPRVTTPAQQTEPGAPKHPFIEALEPVQAPRREGPPHTGAEPPPQRPDRGSRTPTGANPPGDVEEEESLTAQAAGAPAAPHFSGFLGSGRRKSRIWGSVGGKGGQPGSPGPPAVCPVPPGLTWLVDHVVDPALALLHPQVPPLGLRQEVGLGHQLRDVLGQHHVPGDPAPSAATGTPRGTGTPPVHPPTSREPGHPLPPAQGAITPLPPHRGTVTGTPSRLPSSRYREASPPMEPLPGQPALTEQPYRDNLPPAAPGSRH